MYETNLTVLGTVASEITLRHANNGQPVANFRLVTTERRYDRDTGGWSDGTTTFLGVSCWRALAANVVASVSKGDPIVVHGRLRVKSWDKEGVRHRDVEIDALSVGHDLQRGTAMFRRTQKKSIEVAERILSEEEHPVPTLVGDDVRSRFDLESEEEIQVPSAA